MAAGPEHREIAYQDQLMMERSVTAVATGLLFAVFAVLGVTALLGRLLPLRGPADEQIARSMLSLFLGGLSGVAGFVVVSWLVRERVPSASLQTLQVVDGLVLATAGAWAVVVYASVQSRPAPYYEGCEARLEVELRVAKALLQGGPLSDQVVVQFGTGESFDKPRPELVREEGEDLVLPVEITVIRLRDWSITVLFGEDKYNFPLDFPKRPAGSLPWSAWIAPKARRGWATSPSLAVRARWVVVPR